jgi:two-component system response regulator LytT
LFCLPKGPPPGGLFFVGQAALDQIEKLLDRHLFFRINRQFIIHIDAIRKILTYYNSRLILQLHPDAGTDVIISRERVADFRSWLEGKHIIS